MDSYVSSRSTLHQVLRINLDEQKPRTIAETDAGLEVARLVYFAGAAVASIARTGLAYEMQFSVAIHDFQQNQRYANRGQPDASSGYA